MDRFARLRRVLSFVGLMVVPATTVGCYDILGLGNFTNQCPEVAEGKDCPDAGAAGSTGSSSSGGSALCVPGTQKACLYGGPSATKDVGACKAGLQTCNQLFGP